MSEVAYKRRLRARKRTITATLKDHRVHDSDGHPFHLLAYKGKSLLAIRICFGHTETSDILSVGREPMPNRCRREIWQISEDGRRIVRARIT